MQKLSLLVLLSVVLFSCKDDGEDTKGGSSNTGVWQAKLNGNDWIAGKVEKKTTVSGDFAFTAWGNSDASAMIATFESSLKAGQYTFPDPNTSFAFYPEASKPSTSETANDALLTVKKFDQDSLVATFSFTTPTRNFTNGVIKIKLN